MVDDGPALVSVSGVDVDDVVGVGADAQTVRDADDGCSVVDEAVEQGEEAVGVVGDGEVSEAEVVEPRKPDPLSRTPWS